MGSSVKKIGIATDGSKSAKVMQLAVMSGLAGAGSAVTDFGEAFEAQLNFLVNFCGLDSGIFISGGDGREIKLCGEGGLSITRGFERAVENAMAKCEFREASENEITEISEMASVKQLYMQELLKQAVSGLQGVGAVFECENEGIKTILTNCALRLGACENSDLIFKIDATGTMLSAVYAGESYDHEKLLAVCCDSDMKNGRNIAVPYDAPAFLDSLAESRGRKVYRYLTTPADDADSAARSLAAKQVYVRDGLFLAIKLLSIMKERECTLDRLAAELPEKYIVRKTVIINFAPSGLSSVIGEESVRSKNDYEGIRLIKRKGKLLVVPERSGRAVRILAEADTMEAAQELCADIEELIGSAGEQ